MTTDLQALKPEPAAKDLRSPSLYRWAVRFRPYFSTIVELLILLAAALWVGRNLLNFDPYHVPYGPDFLPNLQTQHFWDNVKECGLCALWNGGMQGGLPALPDILGANLHPLTAVLFLILGPINGSKMLVLCAVWLAGFGQWLLARELGLGRTARVWGALFGAVGAHLAGRMDNGLVTVVLSTAMASLALPAALRLARLPSWRTTVLLGFLLALTAVSGHGYIQIGLIFSAPLFLILLLNERLRFTSSARYFLAAIGLALLLAAPLLVPLIHFYPNFIKPSEPTFNNGQPLEYLVLNLVIHDLKFLSTDLLQKPGIISMNTLYIGWLPVLLAGLSLAFVRGEKRRILVFLWSFSLLMFWLASGELLQLLNQALPTAMLVRWPTVVASLAVVPLLGLSSYALDQIMRWNGSVQFSVNAGQPFHFRAVWLLFIPLTLSFLQTRAFSENFYFTYFHEFGKIRQILKKVEQPALQWITPPDGNWPFYEMATQMKMKISPGFRPYEWIDRSFPEAKWIIRSNNDEVEGANLFTTSSGYFLYTVPEGNDYAFIVNDEGEEIQPCAASGWGGDLLVVCNSDQPGALVVKENQWHGWYAWRDGRSVPLLDGQWLSTDAPGGEHTYRFRYLPWDAAVGVLLCLAGMFLSAWLWRKAV